MKLRRRKLFGEADTLRLRIMRYRKICKNATPLVIMKQSLKNGYNCGE
jgi:hypothetical protein